MVNLRPNDRLVTTSPIAGNIPPADEQGGDPGPREKVEKVPFAVLGTGVAFTPKIHPETVRVRKVRNLNRTKNHCKGEDVSDDGAENREIHTTGRIIGHEKYQLDALADTDLALDLTCATWSGEVRVSEVEYEGPTGWDPSSGYYYYDYTLDLVATGPPDAPDGNGIVSDEDPIDSVNTDVEDVQEALAESETGVGG